MRAKLFFGLLSAMLVAFAIPALAASTTLPGGTSFEVTITSPANGAVLPANVAYTVNGRAQIGTANPVANTIMVTIIDVSGSTYLSVATTACGNQNTLHDNVSNTVLDCELAAAKAVNDEAVASGTVEKVGIIGFAGRLPGTSALLANEASALDLVPGGGNVTLIPPGQNLNGNGIRDVNEVLNSAYNANVAGTFNQPPGDLGVGFTNFSTFTSPGNTNYWAAITQLKTLLQGQPASKPKIVVMLSDGESNVGSSTDQHVSAALAGIDPTITIFTFAIGGAATCAGSAGNFGSLQEIANATHGACQIIANPANAAQAVPDLIKSKITAFGINNTGSASLFDAPTSITPVPPATLVAGAVTGPATVTFGRTYPALAATPGTKTLCARATGSDGGGSAILTSCITVTFKAQPVVIPNGGQTLTTPEGSALPIGATVIGEYTAAQWTILPNNGVCTFADPLAVDTTVTCSDNGSFQIALTVHDGVNPDVVRVQTLNVTNVAPSPTIALSPSTIPTGGSTNVHVDFTDPGSDAWTCAFDFDSDGVVDLTVPAIGMSCDAAPTFPISGGYTVSVRVSDDDGGSGIASASLTVKAPPSIALDGGTGTVGPTNEGSSFSVGATVDGATSTTWSAAGGTGTCTFADPSATQTTITCNDDGPYTLMLTAVDEFGQTTAATQSLGVNNVPPTLLVTSPAAGASSRSVTFTGTVSDPGSGDTLSCAISWGDGSSSNVPAIGGTCTGAHTYAAAIAAATIDAYSSDDNGGSSALVTRSLTFNRAPSCATVSASPNTLWEPNHSFVLITLSGGSDPDAGDTIAFRITGVTQDEPTFGLGSGDFASDAILLSIDQLMLRAERDGSGDGRVYTIAYTLTDTSGASCGGTAEVTVPHDRSHPTAIKGSQSYDSFQGDSGKKNK